MLVNILRMYQNIKGLGIALMAFSALLLVILTFVKLDFDKQSQVLCEKFHENQLNMAECPAHNNNFSWMIIVAYSIGFITLVIGIYLFLLKTESSELAKEFKEVDLSKLNDEEKKIYEIIQSKDGSAFQSDLVRETGFSKVKVTRILDMLESKDVLERKRRGMTNIIVLK